MGLLLMQGLDLTEYELNVDWKMYDAPLVFSRRSSINAITPCKKVGERGGGERRWNVEGEDEGI